MERRSGNSGSGRGSGRDLSVRVKTARGRKTSSARWLQRQLNDPYVLEAKKLGLRSRAAFKLIEMDDRYGFLKAGMRVLDLGATPGGWAQVAVQRTGPKGQVVAADINPMDPLDGVEFVQSDFEDEAAPAQLRGMLRGAQADVVLSDMAAPATGHKPTDHLRIVALAELAADFAVQILAPGGTFLAKVLQGGSEADLLVLLKKSFETVRHVKPKASRADSAELYVLATGFRSGAS